MEDGSALSPLVAAQTSPLGVPSAAARDHQTVSALNYCRLLAKMCNCPVSPSTVSPANNGSPLAGTMNNFALEQQQAIITSSSGGSVVASNGNGYYSNMIDCLRHKSLDELVQLVPMKLLKLDQQQELTMAKAVLLNNIPSLDQHSNQLPINNNNNSGFVPVDGDFIRGYIQRVTTNQIIAAIMQQQPSIEDDLDNSPFGAIYRPAGIKPLFGPIVDGSMVPDEVIKLMSDTGGTMSHNQTSTSSDFHGYDLLIGVSSSAVYQQQQQQHGQLQLSGNFLYNQLSNWHELRGFSYDQLVEQTTKFVRTFFRYHNQEIINSIVNHYANSLASATENTKSPDDGVQQQLYLFKSITEAFNDALTYVPVLRTALIHAQQALTATYEQYLDKLIDIKISDSQQHDDLSNNRHIRPSSSDWLDGLNSTILQQIVKLSTLNNNNRTSSTTNKHSKSTYFYQFLSGANSNLNFVNLLLLNPPDLEDHSDDPQLDAKRRQAEKLASIWSRFVKWGQFQVMTNSSDDDTGDDAGDDVRSNAKSQNNYLTTRTSSQDDNLMITGDEYGDLLPSTTAPPPPIDNTMNKIVDWPQFDPFNQDYIQFEVRIKSSNEQRTTMVATTELEYMKFSQNQGSLRRALFWTNFIPTLNCSRTQPIAANNHHGLQWPDHQMINLHFTCQHGPKTSLDYLLNGAQNYFKSKMQQQLFQQQQQVAASIKAASNAAAAAANKIGSSTATRSASIDNYNSVGDSSGLSDSYGNLVPTTTSTQQTITSSLGVNNNVSSLLNNSLVHGDQSTTAATGTSNNQIRSSNFNLLVIALLLGMIILTGVTILAFKTGHKTRPTSRQDNPTSNHATTTTTTNMKLVKDPSCVNYDPSMLVNQQQSVSQLDANNLQQQQYGGELLGGDDDLIGDNNDEDIAKQIYHDHHQYHHHHHHDQDQQRSQEEEEEEEGEEGEEASDHQQSMLMIANEHQANDHNLSMHRHHLIGSATINGGDFMKISENNKVKRSETLDRLGGHYHVHTHNNDFSNGTNSRRVKIKEQFDTSNMIQREKQGLRQSHSMLLNRQENGHYLHNHHDLHTVIFSQANPLNSNGIIAPDSVDVDEELVQSNSNNHTLTTNTLSDDNTTTTTYEDMDGGPNVQQQHSHFHTNPISSCEHLFTHHHGHNHHHHHQLTMGHHVHMIQSPGDQFNDAYPNDQLSRPSKFSSPPLAGTMGEPSSNCSGSLTASSPMSNNNASTSVDNNNNNNNELHYSQCQHNNYTHNNQDIQHPYMIESVSLDDNQGGTSSNLHQNNMLTMRPCYGSVQPAQMLLIQSNPHSQNMPIYDSRSIDSRSKSLLKQVPGIKLTNVRGVEFSDQQQQTKNFHLDGDYLGEQRQQHETPFSNGTTTTLKRNR